MRPFYNLIQILSATYPKWHNLSAF